MSWQKSFKQGFSSAKDLLEYLGLPSNLYHTHAETSFKTRVPLSFAQRMQYGDPQDPLLQQVLARIDEIAPQPGYAFDPLQEAQFNPLPGLVHKYPGRVLITLTGSCAVNCRYCFRRHFPYAENNPGKLGRQAIMDYIQNDTGIHEVIFSGGDPLMATNLIWAEVCQALLAIPHVHTLRIHTRIPIVLPERIEKDFLKILTNLPLKKVMVLHCNHAQEIDDQVKKTCQRLSQAGCTLLNQSVLLKNINDDAHILAMLSERLFDCGVLPYYLHVLDKVAGAHHFDLPETDALLIHQKLQTLLPGYLVPRLAKEEPGRLHKSLLIA